MKKFKKILIWIIISLVLQTAFLFYLSNFYLVDDYKVTFTQEKSVTSMKEDIKIKLPLEASNIKLSSSGKYASYMLKDVLHVINLKDGKDNIIDLTNSINNYFFKWHDSEEKMIISEKKSTKNEAGIKIYIYNAKENLKQEALDYNNNSRTYKFSTTNVDVTDIQLNTLNTILYVKASSKNGTSYINRLDISDGMYKVPLKTSNIGRFFVLRQKDELAFEDITKGKVYITNKSKTEEIKISNTNKLKLLQVDKNDNIYIGELENGAIKTIFYNKNENYKEWSSIKLSKPMASDDIFLFNGDDIYTIDKVKSVAVSIKNNEQITFEWKFIDMNDKEILSLNNGDVIITKLNNIGK